MTNLLTLGFAAAVTARGDSWRTAFSKGMYCDAEMRERFGISNPRLADERLSSEFYALRRAQGLPSSPAHHLHPPGAGD